MTQPIRRQTTVALPNERMPHERRIELARQTIAAQLDAGERLIGVQLGPTGTALRGNDHLASWPVTYAFWPANTE